MAKIAIIGAGYVGLTTGACLAHLGHDVIIADNKDDRVKSLKAGIIPFYEPGLEELVSDVVKSERLSFVLGAAKHQRMQNSISCASQHHQIRR